MKNLGHCSKQVYDGSFFGHKCTRDATVVENGRPYCTMHSAEGEAKRKAKADARYEAKKIQWDEEYERKKAIHTITQGFTTERLRQYKDEIRTFIEKLEGGC